MNVLFLGPPGAGKGTVAQKIKDEMGLIHLSTGDMLRAQIAAGSELGLAAKAFMDDGKLVPDEVIIGMVADKLREVGNNVLFDGFPRTVNQAVELDSITNLDKVIYLDITLDVVKRRICSRRTCKRCGRVFGSDCTTSNCHLCGGELYTRDDDNEATVEKRFNEYALKTSPLIEYYDKQGKLRKLDGDQSIDAVVVQAREALA